MTCVPAETCGGRAGGLCGLPAGAPQGLDGQEAGDEGAG